MPTTSNFGWTTPADTDLVKDGALAIRTLGNGIDTSMAQLKGGTTGQVLSKTSGTDMAFTWTTPQVGDITAVNAGTGISGGGTSGDVTITNSMATTIDAKGDLIVGTANDTFARLAVGNNGETLVADSSATTGLRYNPPLGSLANPVINGGMDVWQRGTSVAVAASTANVYTVDRWITYTFANEAITVSRQSTNDTTNLPNIQYCARYQRNSGQTGTTILSLAQNIESINSIPFAGKTVTMSFYARAGANFSASSNLLVAALISGTGTDQNYLVGFTGTNIVATSNITLTTTWQRFTITGTLPTTATQLCPIFQYTPTGTAGANDYYEVTGVQIDVGTWTASTAPTFRRSGGTLAGELSAAQRYYWRQNSDATALYAIYGTGVANATTNAGIVLNNPVQMRTTPTTIDFATLQVNDGATITAVTSAAIVAGRSTPRITAVDAGVASGLTVSRFYIFGANNSGSSYIGIGAEL